MYVHSKGSVSFNNALLAVALSVNLFLGWQIHSIKRTIAHADDVSSAAKVGMMLSPISVMDLDGKKVKIDFSETAPTVLYVMSPSCRWCSRNLANIRKLAASESGQFRLIGLAVGDPSLKPYVESVSMGFPVYSISSYEAVANVQLGATPQTLVVEPGGKVVKNWVGAFDNQQRADVEAFFHTQLPGLSAD